MTDPQLTPPPVSVPAPPPVPQAAPPGAYQVPVGGYAAPAGSYVVPQESEPQSRLQGVLALIFALVAAVVTPAVVGFAAFEIGLRIPEGLDTAGSDPLSALSPARDQVLWGEISFWTGTALGIAAVVVGILAIKNRKGRGFGIAALAVSLLGPLIFFLVLMIAFSAGSASGFLEYAT